MKLMQPIMTEKIVAGSEFLYEVKYDGFRVRLEWTENKIRLLSRNQTDLTKQFPEIISSCRSIYSTVRDLLPVQLDGELVVLNNDYEANFSLIQTRGRLKNENKIAESVLKRRASFIAFDILQLGEKQLVNETLIQRKKQLAILFNKISQQGQLKLIHTYTKYEEMLRVVFDYKGEGIIAKRKTSIYLAGKGHQDWFKMKNWRTIYVFITAYNKSNDYFNVAVYDGGAIKHIGTCKHGLNQEDNKSLQTLFMRNGIENKGIYTLPPAICASINTLDPQGNELREPQFLEILPQLSPTVCTMEKIQVDLAMLPDVHLSNEKKMFWTDRKLMKSDLLIFMRGIYPYMIPYLKERALTVIRCPDGIEEESFFQKNLPSYAPDYIDYIEEGDKRIQICNKLESLIWFANHSAIEYHVPFEEVDSTYPSEIVFDLDPPAREKFSLAIEAALQIKQLLDTLELTSFIKTSGNKGLQIHIPIRKKMMSYDETAIFTEAIAKTVERMNPTMFTTERFKKNRGNKLYIDYVQHGNKKTIVAPYSPRKTMEATVATPLYWKEVSNELYPTQFTITNVLARVQTLGCPWLNSYELARDQKLTSLLKMIYK